MLRGKSHPSMGTARTFLRTELDRKQRVLRPNYLNELVLHMTSKGLSLKGKIILSCCYSGWFSDLLISCYLQYDIVHSLLVFN